MSPSLPVPVGPGRSTLLMDPHLQVGPRTVPGLPGYREGVGVGGYTGTQVVVHIRAPCLLYLYMYRYGTGELLGMNLL